MTCNIFFDHGQRVECLQVMPTNLSLNSRCPKVRRWLALTSSEVESVLEPPDWVRSTVHAV